VRPELLVSGRAACTRMCRLMRQVRAAVEFETYIYEAGVVGDRFLAELTGAASAFECWWTAYGSDTLPQGYFALLLDDVMCVGSGNLDVRSLRSLR
jgi:hypothetical protein